MDKNRDIITSNGLILKEIETNVEMARKGIHRINHSIKGKKITRKWVNVFLLFAVWTVFQLVLTEYKNDYLVVITAFSIVFGAVYYGFKPIIKNFERKSYQDLVVELTPHYVGIVEKLQNQADVIAKNNLDFETIYIINDDRIDINLDFTDINLSQKQVYVYIVKALGVDANIAEAAAKFSIHILTKIPFHEL